MIGASDVGKVTPQIVQATFLDRAFLDPVRNRRRFHAKMARDLGLRANSAAGYLEFDRLAYSVAEFLTFKHCLMMYEL